MNFFERIKAHVGWDDAPWWVRRLRDTQLILVLQNEAILAKLEERASKLSPEDQATINEIFDVAKGIVTKDDEALKK